MQQYARKHCIRKIEVKRTIAIRNFFMQRRLRLLKIFGFVLFIPMFLLTTSAVAASNNKGRDFEELLSMSLSDLLNMEVSSVSRRSQSLAETSAAIYVITAKDIKRSSARILPDLLRAVPGIEVAQLDSNKWAISARGFNSRLTSKLLVIIDGHSIYSPTYSTTFWEADDLILDNIERIEIVRGGGATIWGANAVNGVVSITTKSAYYTKGSKVNITASTNENIGTFRYGTALSDETSIRVSGKFRDSLGFDTIDGAAANDDWTSSRVEFRLDSQLSANDSFMLKSDVFYQEISQQSQEILGFGRVLRNIDTDFMQRGIGLSTLWEHTFHRDSVLRSSFAFDSRERNEFIFQEETNSYEIDVIWNRNNINKHNFIIGASTKFMNHQVDNTDLVQISPANRLLELYSLSFHDDIRLTDQLIFGLGLKAEKNSYTGLEYQGSLNLNYSISDRQHVWVAFSRALRTPSRSEVDSELIGNLQAAGVDPSIPFDIYFQLQPSDDLDVEVLHGWELGWRFNHSASFNTDITAFYSDYSALRNADPSNSAYCVPNPFCLMPIQFIVQPVTITNLDTATTKGIEFVSKWNPSLALSFELGGSIIDIHYHSNSIYGTDGTQSITSHREEPLYQYYLKSDWVISPQSSINLVFRHVSPPGIGDIDAYSVIDFQYVNEFRSGLSLSVGARNLGDHDDIEFSEIVVSSASTLIDKSAYLKLEWKW